MSTLVNQRCVLSLHHYDIAVLIVTPVWTREITRSLAAHLWEDQQSLLSVGGEILSVGGEEINVHTRNSSRNSHIPHGEWLLYFYIVAMSAEVCALFGTRP